MKVYETVESIEHRKANPNFKPITQCFMPSRYLDNPHLLINDPNYVVRLNSLPENERVALRDGNWDIASGFFFQEWDKTKHVEPQYQPDRFDELFLTMDFGTQKPSAIYFCAIDGDETIHVYKEIYTQKGATPDEGTNENIEEIASRIMQATTDFELGKIKYMTLDTQCWAGNGTGFSIYELLQMKLQRDTGKIHIIQSNKERVSGWQALRMYLANNPKTGKPFIQVSPSCKHLIRTLPSLVHDKTKHNDVDSRSEDHAADAIRYLINSRPHPAKLKGMEEHKKYFFDNFEVFLMPKRV